MLDVFCSALQLRSSILLLAAKHDLCSIEDIMLVRLTVHTKKEERLKYPYKLQRCYIYLSKTEILLLTIQRKDRSSKLLYLVERQSRVRSKYKHTYKNTSKSCEEPCERGTNTLPPSFDRTIN